MLDCGAAEGIFALRVQERSGLLGIFEPLPLFSSSLSCTFSGLGNVKIVSAALGDKSGEAFFEGSSLYGRISDQPTKTVIPITTIDAWAQQQNTRVDYIKGDLEGFEMNVLKGAARVIAVYKPKIAMTMYHSENNWQEALAFVRDLAPDYQYRLKGLAYSGGKAHPVMIHLWHPK
jgi:FkbM family methyltransferase